MLMPKDGDAPGLIIAASLVFYDNGLYLTGYQWPSEADSINDQSLYVYDLERKLWKIVEVGSEKPERRVFHETFMYNDEMLLGYGLDMDSLTLITTLWKFNFSSKTWRLLSNDTDSAVLSFASAQNGPLIYIIYGRNAYSSFNSIRVFDISEMGLGKQLIADNWYSPGKRRNHCSAIVNDQMLVFGGVTDAGLHLNDLWSFDMSLNVWSYIQVSGTTPGPRELMSCTEIYGTGLLVFGGMNSNEVFNDFYFILISLGTWVEFSPGETAPSPRYSTCLTFISNSFIILGGQNNGVMFSEIWAYAYGEFEFYLLNSEDPTKIDLIDFRCYAEDSAIYTFGGRTQQMAPTNQIYKVEISANSDGSLVSSTSAFYQTRYHMPSDSSLIVTDSFIYMVLGSNWSFAMYPYVWAISLDFTSEFMISVALEESLFGHSAVHYRDSLYVFGGGYSLDNLILASTATNNILKIAWKEGELAPLDCSSGSVTQNCVPCVEGTYDDGSGECADCPPGSYSQVIASSYINQCMPCPYGTFNNKYGSLFCLDCIGGMYCPIGSKAPQEKFEKTHYQSIQPVAYSGNVTLLSNFTYYMWYAVLGAGGLMILATVLSSGIRGLLQRVDLFINQHKQEINVPVVYTRTRIGGLISVIFILTALVTVVSSLLAYYLANITEIKSLVPVLVLNTDVSAKFLQVTTTFYVYGGVCGIDSICVPSITVSDSGVLYSSKQTTCSILGTSCQVSTLYTDFSLTSASTVLISLKECQSMASQISVNLTSSSSIPGSISSEYLPLSTGSDFTVFRGTVPTTISYEFTPSVRDMQVFESQSSQWKADTGYHVMVNQSANIGSVSTQEE